MDPGGKYLGQQGSAECPIPLLRRYGIGGMFYWNGIVEWNIKF